jgi:hypothetical protein
VGNETHVANQSSSSEQHLEQQQTTPKGHHLSDSTQSATNHHGGSVNCHKRHHLGRWRSLGGVDGACFLNRGLRLRFHLPSPGVRAEVSITTQGGDAKADTTGSSRLKAQTSKKRGHGFVPWEVNASGAAQIDCGVVCCVPPRFHA